MFLKAPFMLSIWPVTSMVFRFEFFLQVRDHLVDRGNPSEVG